eukprot:TRINITY_DN46933_c0_g1_i1.p1 TRINITY_DN46933_c0_g1~~TRINITY_DN46933_c0_g1_i1.p1  ORF type:complete len:1037 (+),score=259.82 TRINITY_DN46933_c0_g1_i1:75-3113(+)
MWPSDVAPFRPGDSIRPQLGHWLDTRVRRRGDTEEEATVKKIFIGFAFGIWLLHGPMLAVAVSASVTVPAWALHLAANTVIFLGAIAVVLVTRTLPYWLANGLLLWTLLVTMARDLFTHGVLSLFPVIVLVMDGCLLFRPHRHFPLLAICVTAIWQSAVFVYEAGWAREMYVNAQNPVKEDSCGEKGPRLAGFLLAMRSLVLIMDYLITHRFAHGMRKQTMRSERVAAFSQRVAQLLATLDTRGAQEVVEEAEEEDVPEELLEAFRGVVANLTEFRRYVPDAVVFDGHRAPSVDSRSSRSSTPELEVGGGGASQRSEKHSIDIASPVSVWSTHYPPDTERRTTTGPDTVFGEALSPHPPRQGSSPRQQFPAPTAEMSAHTPPSLALGLARRGITALHSRWGVPEDADSENALSDWEQRCGTFISAVESAVRAHRGVVMEVRAMSALAVWGTHNTLASARPQTCDAAFAISERIPVATTGLCYGVCVSGNVGGNDTRAHVVIGQAVKRAAVLSRMARYLHCRVLADPLVREVARLRFKLRPVDVISDVRTGVLWNVWEVLAPQQDDERHQEWMYRVAQVDTDDSWGDYSAAFEAMRAGDTSGAVKLLDKHLNTLRAAQRRTSASSAADSSPPSSPGTSEQGQVPCAPLPRGVLYPRNGEAWVTLQQVARPLPAAERETPGGGEVDPVAERLRRALQCNAVPVPYARRAPLPPFEMFPGELGEPPAQQPTVVLTDPEEASGKEGAGPDAHQLLRVASMGPQGDVHRHLLNMLLPEPIMRRITHAGAKTLNVVDEYHSCSVLFADMVGYTARTATTPPLQLTQTLMEVFGAFDRLCADSCVTKVKTIGDCYMAVAGAPMPTASHGDCAVIFGLQLIRILAEYNALRANDLSIRVGVNSGSVVGGVIGSRQLCFDLWGDAVNIAARMEQTGEPGLVQVSEATWRILSTQAVGGPDSAGVVRSAQTVEVKGRGPMRTHLLEPQGPNAPELRGYVADRPHKMVSDELLEMVQRELMGF